jgi:lysophospholipase L1-like esterase
VFNGPTLDAMPAAGLFQSDGIHPTAAGAQAVAKVFAQADGIGD